MQKPLNSFRKGLLFVLLLASPILAWAQTLTVLTDRQTVELGDVISLTIQTDFQTSGKQLDLTVLEDQFQVLGKQQSNNIEFINGSFNSRTRWQIQMVAKQVGALIIPSLQIEDAKSQPLTITVLPIKKASKGDLGPYFLESSLSKNQVTVQEEVIYTLRLYFLGSVSGNIRPPQFGHALSEPIKEQSVYGKKLNGQNYSVYEWVYALYPQKSGQLDILGAQFSGLIQYQGRQKGVSEIAETQTVTVLPEVAEFNNQSKNLWLPASDLQLKEQWISALDKVRVGDSLTRTLTLKVDGLMASQLPALTTENGSGFKVYADQPVSKQTIVKSSLQSQIQVKQAIIPMQEGQIVLPEQTITWWNTTTQKIERSSVPARSITVLPALITQAPLINKGQVFNPDALKNQQTGSISVDQQINSMVSREANSIWQIISLLMTLAWVSTLLLWRRKHKQLQANIAALQPEALKSTESDQAWSTTEFELCQTDKQGQIKLTPQQFYNKLRVTLAEEHKIHQFEALNYPELQNAIRQLETHLFNQEILNSDTLSEICRLLNHWSIKMGETQSPSASKLSSLYGK
ncbi:MAG: BatD family protein [Thiomicrorhabdus sp.]|jgi:hypothetical protein|nr:BatD family protein [Thiomicrorhabdus sp.]